jgi:hypothetical protein
VTNAAATAAAKAKGPAYRACGATRCGIRLTQDVPGLGHTRDVTASHFWSGSRASGLTSQPAGRPASGLPVASRINTRRRCTRKRFAYRIPSWPGGRRPRWSSACTPGSSCRALSSRKRNSFRQAVYSGRSEHLARTAYPCQGRAQSVGLRPPTQTGTPGSLHTAHRVTADGHTGRFRRAHRVADRPGPRSHKHPVSLTPFSIRFIPICERATVRMLMPKIISAVDPARPQPGNVCY